MYIYLSTYSIHLDSDCLGILLNATIWLQARFVSSSGSDGKTGNKNVLKSDVARFTSHFWTCLATNSIGSWSSVNTDSWLDKITRESRHTRQLRHFLQNKLTWNYSLPSVIAFPNLQPVADPGEGSGGPGPPLSKGLDDRPPPLSKGLDAALATTWFVARQVWMWVVKRRNVAQFCRNVAKQVARFRCPFNYRNFRGIRELY